jgi:AcrR family transcriptional regulator
MVFERSFFYSTSVLLSLGMDGRIARGQRTRASILERAVDLASVEGLEGLTIGRLATELEMSKSGLFAHFGSREDLQLAVNEAARERFAAAVLEPLRALAPGPERLDTFLRGWLDYMRREIFEGGGVVFTARAEFDARPSGPVRDAVLSDQRTWRRVLAREIASGLGDGANAEQLAFEVDAIGMAANLEFQLERDPATFDRAAAAFAARGLLLTRPR